jgi:PIN domain nuclease of toxin-antitoxin system
VRLLIDTHILIWTVRNEPKIPAKVAAAMRSPDNSVHVSAVTPWEIAIKTGLGKMTFDWAFLQNFDARMHDLAFETLPITSAHGVAAGRLTGPNRDPFDRMLAAQAAAEGLTLVTADRKLDGFGVPIFWA